jgi:methionyl-tRNA formyltransferase
MKELRIVFMGTPEFAVASLDALVNTGYNIVGVVTAPDKPAGRGMKITESAVKKYAVDKGLHILQPEKLKDPKFIDDLGNLKADLQIVVAFRMLPLIVWNMPPMGTVNVHGSLLPDYRGAAPINWAVMNGEKETGVTTFKLKHEIDTGDILLQDKFAIGENENATEVHDRMKIIGANLLVKTIQALEAGTIKENPQLLSSNQPKHAPKLFTKDCEINWNESASHIHNKIRGLSIFPGALTKLEDKILKIFQSQKEIITHNHPIGTVICDGKKILKFACMDGFIQIMDLQLEGKKRMLVEDFLRGFRISS